MTSKTAMALNKGFRGKKEPAGVLSFPSPGQDPEGERGEVLLCVESVAKLAAKRAKTLKAMISLLTIHGVLHVLGFHHANDSDFELMAALERAIARKLAAKGARAYAG